MCKFKKKITDLKSVKGYKLAIKDKYNHYYSIITGVRYEVGKVKAATKYGMHNIREDLCFRDVLNPHNRCFKNEYTGKTAVFVDRNSVIKFKESQESQESVLSNSFANKLVILEMELTGELYYGEYNISTVYIGSEIKSIKKVKE